MTDNIGKRQAIKIATKYIESLKNKYDIRDVILFGSYARNTYHTDSDIDLAIIMNNVTDRIDMQAELMKLRRKVDLRIEPHPFDYSDFNQNDPMVDEIRKYGITLEVA